MKGKRRKQYKGAVIDGHKLKWLGEELRVEKKGINYKQRSNEGSAGLFNGI
jgi:hypothetical protein